MGATEFLAEKVNVVRTLPWASRPARHVDHAQFGQLKSGMNLQYGAVMLAPDDVIMAASDGLGDVLDPIAAKVPPKQFGLRFAVRALRHVVQC